MHLDKTDNIKFSIFIISTISGLAKIIRLRLLMLLNSGGILRPIFRKYWKDKKLNVGEQNTQFTCWGWETMDLLNADYRIDLRKMEKFPFKSESVSLVYSSHLIEHIDDNAAQQLFCELCRALKPGGTIRIACPDIDKAINAYGDNCMYFFKGALKTFIPRIEKGDFPEESIQPHNLLVNVFACYSGRGDTSGPPVIDKELVDRKLSELDTYEFAKWCTSQLEPNRIYDHINAYDYDKLYHMLKKAGFDEIEKCKFRESKIKEFCSPSFDKSKYLLTKKYDSTSLIVEARKRSPNNS